MRLQLAQLHAGGKPAPTLRPPSAQESGTERRKRRKNNGKKSKEKKERRGKDNNTTYQKKEGEGNRTFMQCSTGVDVAGCNTSASPDWSKPGFAGLAQSDFPRLVQADYVAGCEIDLTRLVQAGPPPQVQSNPSDSDCQ
mmetsp:Transcript_25330/g.58866  ORF Transcript_25330/g.58866 Transcript_25330/m.58866 type:complete len:139 (-) Transcript_25330:18-434(-)